MDTSLNTQTTPETASQSKLSAVKMMLHAEGAAVFIAAVVLYILYNQAAWWVIFPLWLVPDLALIPYAINQNVGIAVYNVVHHYGLPIALGVFALITGWNFGVTLALVWFVHIGLDRAVGYGFKYSGKLKETHLQRT